MNQEEQKASDTLGLRSWCLVGQAFSPRSASMNQEEQRPATYQGTALGAWLVRLFHLGQTVWTRKSKGLNDPCPQLLQGFFAVLSNMKSLLFSSSFFHFSSFFFFFFFSLSPPPPSFSSCRLLFLILSSSFSPSFAS